MKEEQILAVIKSLASSQGSYGRMYSQLMDAKETNPNAYKEFITNLEEQNLSDAVDLVMYLES